MATTSAANLVPLVIQPAFDRAIQSLPSPLGVTVPLQRGYMIWDRSGGAMGYKGGELGDGRDVIHFLFNPSTVTADYNVMNTAATAALMFQDPNDHGTYVPQTLSQTVSFDLYFDRTYELNYGNASGSNSDAINDPAVIGVQADVYQFMQFTGVTRQADIGKSAYLSQLSGAQAQFSNQVIGTLRTSGLIQMIPAHVFFGNALAQQNANASVGASKSVQAQVQYYGFISEWTVNYTHWTSNMVPIRAVISVVFTMLSLPKASNAAAVWQDGYKLGTGAPVVSPPYAVGYVPPTNVFQPGR